MATRTWMVDSNKGDYDYEAGLVEFYEFVLNNVKDTNKVACPCDRCLNMKYMSFSTVKIHLEKNMFSSRYRRWIFHGESRIQKGEKITKDNLGIDNENSNVRSSCDEFMTNVSDDDNVALEDELLENYEFEDNENDFEDDRVDDDDEDDENDMDTILEKLHDSEIPLYTGCEKYTKLSAVVKLYNLKATNEWSDKSFTDLLSLLNDILPIDNVLPTKTYDAKKMLRGMGMKYKKIHACPNDCILYRKDYEGLSNCPKCNEWRYKIKEGIPAKVLWYFPIIPRLRRLFANKEDAKNLKWHKTGRLNDGKLRHPADGVQWKSIDSKYPEFGMEPRNIRLALSTDGMNPHGNMSTQHSTWPVLLAIYNLPPYLCMKRKYLMLSLLISGPKEPGNDIDVYLGPLLDDLQILWEKGIEVFDADENKIFNLRAMLLCTISDFPAYGNLSGHTVGGEKACPICGDDIESMYLPFSHKTVYLGHRRWLDDFHPYRKQTKTFNGSTEHRPRPKVLSGYEVYEKVKDINIVYGKKSPKLPTKGYKKMSPMFKQLSYWKDLSVRHCLDFMHIEKNVCDNIINTLLNVPNKSKDNAAARNDMVKTMKIRPELAPVPKGNRTYLPPAAHTLSKKEKYEFCKCLHGIKVPEGYSSNISSLVSLNELKLGGMKSHDCHTLMQQLLPVAIRSILPKKVRDAISRMCFFFNAICSKVIDPNELQSLEKLIITTLCQFEMYFPPSFFTIMVHLTVHLVREVIYLGPVYLRYQYPFERLMKVYKDYTTNRYRPEGCIAERAIIDEALSYCYDYIASTDLIGVPTNRHSEWMMGKGIRGHVRKRLSLEKLSVAHTYVLHNEDEVSPYIHQHMVYLKARHRNKSERWIANEHNKTFKEWFKTRVLEDLKLYPDNISSRLRRLCHGPDYYASSYSGFAINGFTFYTNAQDKLSTMQNSGVCVEAEALHFASSKDKNPILGKMLYYGVIENIWVLDYSDFDIPIFECKWIESNNGVRNDEFFTLVNFGKIGHKDDPYILASQAKQVFYVVDPSDNKWSVVLSARGRRTPGICDENITFEGFESNKIYQVDDDVDVIMSESESNIYMRFDHEDGIWDFEGESSRRKRQRS